MINVGVTDAGRLLAKFTKLQTKMKAAVAKGTTRAAILLQKSAREKILNGPKSGRRYGGHQASSPGEAPANESGQLQRSISIVKAKPGITTEASVIAGTQYAKALHFGTKTAGRNRSVIIEPRPFLDVDSELASEMDRVIKEEIAKARGGTDD